MIQGREIQLRAIEPSDAQAYYLWINDQETNQYRGLHFPTSRDQAHAWIEERRLRRPDGLALAVTLPDSALVGFVELQNICARSQRAELRVYIGDKSRWNQGLGSDAVQALCRFAFDQMNLHRLWLECDPAHPHIVRCYEKVGFRMEGTLRDAYYRHGSFRNTCIMGLLRGELQEKPDGDSVD